MMSKRQFAAALCLMTVAAFAGGLVAGLVARPAIAQAANGELVGTGLRIVDNDGKHRAGISIGEAGVVVSLFDESGRQRVTLGVNDRATGFSLIATDGNRRLTVGELQGTATAWITDREGRTLWGAP